MIKNFVNFLILLQKMLLMTLNLTEAEKSVLCKGLQILLWNMHQMIFFELLFRDIKTANVKTLQSETIKFKLLDTAFSLFDVSR